MKNGNLHNEDLSKNPTNNSPNTLLDCLLSIPPAQFTLFSTLIGLLIVEGLTIDQQNTLGNFIVGIGQAILVAAAQGQYLESLTPQDNPLRCQLDLLKKQLCLLEQEMDA